MSEAILSDRRGPVVDAFLATEGIASLERDLGRLFIVVGVFDGLHRGHLYLLRQLRAAARRHAARPAVITFDAHPREIITGSAPPQLLDPDERLVRLAAAGVEVTVVQHFDRQLRETSYGDFVRMIRDRVELAGFLMTPDAAFGHERRGTPEALGELGRELGFAVDVVPPLTLDDRPVRSSEIREAVSEGELGAARHLLGRSFSVVGDREGDALAAAGADWSATASLTFAVPVALPPVGRYQVAVGPAWTLGSPQASAAVRGVATVTDHRPRLEIAAQGSLPASDRLRVVFQRRLRRSLDSGSVAGERQA